MKSNPIAFKCSQTRNVLDFCVTYVVIEFETEYNCVKNMCANRKYQSDREKKLDVRMKKLYKMVAVAVD